MNEISKITGRKYGLFDYYGAEDAERVIIAMGSVTEAAREAIDHPVANGEKVGFLVAVHLYRPFSAKHFLAAVPKTVKKIAVLDRTKEPANGEPLYLDVKDRSTVQRMSGYRRRPLWFGFQGHYSRANPRRLQEPGYADAEEPLHYRYRRRRYLHFSAPGRRNRIGRRRHVRSQILFRFGR